MKVHWAVCLLALLCLTGCEPERPDALPAVREPDPTVQSASPSAETSEPPVAYADVDGSYQITVHQNRYASDMLLLLPTEEGAAEISIVSETGLAEAFPADSEMIMQDAPGVWQMTYDADGNGGGDSVSLDPEAQVVTGYCRAGDETFYLLLDRPEHQTLLLPSGEEINLAGIFAGEARARWLVGTPEGLALLCSDGQAAALDQLRQVLWTQQFSGEILTALETEDQRILVLTQWETMAMLQTLDLTTGQLTPVGVVPQALCGCQMTPGGRWGYDLLAWDAEALYGWSAGASTVDRLFRWDSLGLNGANIRTMAPLSETQILAGYWDEAEAAWQLVRVQRGTAADPAQPSPSVSWRQESLALLEAAQDGAGALRAVGLADLGEDGWPDLILWRTGETDGAVYAVSDGAAEDGPRSVYPGSPPEEDWVLRAADGQSLSPDEAADWVRSWPGAGLPDEPPVSLEEAVAGALTGAVRKTETLYHLEMEVPAEYAEDLTCNILEQNLFQFCDGETQAQTGMQGLCWSVVGLENAAYEAAYDQDADTWAKGMLNPQEMQMGRDGDRVYLLHFPSDVQYAVGTEESYYRHYLCGYAMLTDFFTRNGITPSPFWEAAYREKLCAMADFGGDFRRVEFDCGERESEDPALTAWAARVANLSFLDGEAALSWRDAAVYRLMEAVQGAETGLTKAEQAALCADALPTWSLLPYLDPEDAADQAVAALLDFTRQLEDQPLLADACASARWQITAGGGLWTLTCPPGTLTSNPAALMEAAQAG